MQHYQRSIMRYRSAMISLSSPHTRPQTSLLNNIYPCILSTNMSSNAKDLPNSYGKLNKDKANTNSFVYRKQSQAPVKLMQSLPPPSKIDTLDDNLPYQKAQQMSISEDIKKAKNNNDPAKILQLLTTARQRNIVLSVEEYKIGIWAASVDSSSSSKESLHLYQILANANELTLDVFVCVLRVCSRYGLGSVALNIIKQYQAMGLEFSDEVLVYLILTLVRTGEPGFFGKVRYFYRQHYFGVISGKFKANKKLMEDVASCFSYGEFNSRETLLILNQYTDQGFEPTFEFCYLVLIGGLHSQDANVLSVVGSWLLNYFDQKLEEGILLEMAKISLIKEVPPLAKLVVKLVEKYNPTSKVHVWYYYYWALSSTLSSVSHLIESLVETQKAGYNLYSFGKTSLSHQTFGDIIRDRVVSKLCQKVQEQDELYFSLVELVRNNIQVPKILLDALVTTPAFGGKYEKSFSTFDEYESLFGISHDIHSYNGILQVVSYRIRSWTPLMDVLQSIEAKKIKLNRLTFTIIFEKMLSSGDFTDFDAVCELMKSQGLYPSLSVLRRITIKFVKYSDYQGVRDCLWLYCWASKTLSIPYIGGPLPNDPEKDSYNYLKPEFQVPDYFLRRIIVASGTNWKNIQSCLESGKLKLKSTSDF